MLPSIEFWRTAGIITAAMGQTSFVVLYLTFPWWRTFLGRALFFKAVAFVLLLDVAVVGRTTDWEGEDVTFIVLYWLLSIGIWFQFFAFLRVRTHRQQNSVSGNLGRDGADR